MEGMGREWSVGGRNRLQPGEDEDEGQSSPLALEPPGSEPPFSAGWTTAHDPIRAGQRGASGRAHSDPKPVNPEFRPTSSLPGGLLWGQHDFREPQLPRPGGITAVRMRLEACRSSVEVTESRLRTSFQRSSGQ